VVPEELVDLPVVPVPEPLPEEDEAELELEPVIVLPQELEPSEPAAPGVEEVPLVDPAPELAVEAAGVIEGLEVAPEDEVTEEAPGASKQAGAPKRHRMVTARSPVRNSLTGQNGERFFRHPSSSMGWGLLVGSNVADDV
jgi:hypothetical protein